MSRDEKQNEAKWDEVPIFMSGYIKCRYEKMSKVERNVAKRNPAPEIPGLAFT